MSTRAIIFMDVSPNLFIFLLGINQLNFVPTLFQLPDYKACCLNALAGLAGTAVDDCGVQVLGAWHDRSRFQAIATLCMGTLTLAQLQYIDHRNVCICFFYDCTV
jgi:hypothetical protein